jgi:N-acetyl-1-D-myo-inositol-2-amino-2-deoxy-alpha-D-glucopyranoside deacetylase
MVHAHPDDETILTGGTLARYAAEGVRTIVVTCTRGDLGFPLPGAASTAQTRASELAAALNHLGVSRHVQLGYLDSGMAGQPENDRAGSFFRADLTQVAERLAEVIRSERPQVLVTYDATGGYGHPDHIQVHHVSVAAARLAPVEKLYFVRIPISWSRGFVSSLRQAGIAAPGSAPAGADAGADVQEIGVPDEVVTTCIDVRRYIDRKRAALACHVSQLGVDHFLRQMPLELAQRLWAYEFYSLETSPLPPGGEGQGDGRCYEDDLFAGLT